MDLKDVTWMLLGAFLFTFFYFISHHIISSNNAKNELYLVQGNQNPQLLGRFYQTDLLCIKINEGDTFSIHSLTALRLQNAMYIIASVGELSHYMKEVQKRSLLHRSQYHLYGKIAQNLEEWVTDAHFAYHVLDNAFPHNFMLFIPASAKRIFYEIDKEHHTLTFTDHDLAEHFFSYLFGSTGLYHVDQNVKIITDRQFIQKVYTRLCERMRSQYSSHYEYILRDLSEWIDPQNVTPMHFDVAPNPRLLF